MPLAAHSIHRASPFKITIEYEFRRKICEPNRCILSLVLTLTLLLALPFPVFASKPASVNVQILAINDFHGALDPALTKPSSTDQTTWYYRGGAEYLANFVNAAAATNSNTVKVSAGDMIGASPLLSSIFHDEPTINAFNLMGFEFSAVGNHEFDEGW